MRTISWFSCGSASAVATKIILKQADADIVYTQVIEEHPDNERFLKDCEKWFGKKITVLRNEQYSASIYEVFEKTKFLVGPTGAACSRLLKKKLRKEYEQAGDIQVFGFTVEEKDRLDRFKEQNPDVNIIAPLIDREMTKDDCIALINNSGIEIPEMYKLGYRNNNCIGCVKGGRGYWNKIRVDFPEVFERMVKVEEALGRTILRNNGEPLKLIDLEPNAGNYPMEPDISCGIFCKFAEDEING